MSRTAARGAGEPFGERVRRARREAQKTLRDLSRATKISQSTLSRIESGLVTPSFPDVVSIARELGWPLLFFATGRQRSGTDPRDIIAHLSFWGIRDLASRDRPVVGEVLSIENSIALAIGPTTTSRIIESIPGLLLRRAFAVDESIAAAARVQMLHRLGWACEVAAWIAGRVDVSRLHPAATERLRRVREHAFHIRQESSPDEWDWDLMGNAPDAALLERWIKATPEITRKWRIAFDTRPERFLERARTLLEVPLGS